MSAALAGRPALAQQPPVLHPSSATPTPFAFDIPAGPLDVVLKAFGAGAGLTSIFSIPADTASMMHSPGVSGTFSIDDALDARCSMAPASAFRRSGTTVDRSRSRGVSESVEVTGRITAVSTPKLTEPLRDIPQTITVIPRAVMEEQGATTLRDVLRNVAGITFQAGEGGVPAGDQLSIRGFSARTDMFVDGVRDFGGYSRDSFNMEQVEVAKGPTSSLAGRGSTGGAINQVSKAPSLGADRRRHDRRRQRRAISARPSTSISRSPTLPIPGTAIRLNAMWTDTDVPESRSRRARRAGAWRRRSASASARSTRATVSYFKLKQDNLPEYGLPWVPANTNPELAAYANGTPPVDQSNFYGLGHARLREDRHRPGDGRRRARLRPADRRCAT